MRVPYSDAKPKTLQDGGKTKKTLQNGGFDKKKKTKKRIVKKKQNTKEEKLKVTKNKKIPKKNRDIVNKNNKTFDVCTILEKCSIDEISKYLIKLGKKKNFPDITLRE